MKFINEAYDNGFLAGQNDIIDNRILDEFPYPEINNNNPDLIINQEDYGNYMVNNEHSNENNQENNDDESMDDDDEDMDQYKYLGVKNLKLNVNVTDPDVDPNDVIVDYDTVCRNYGNTMTVDVINNPVTVLPGYKIAPTQENPNGVRYSSMKNVKFNLKNYGFEITASDLKYDNDTPGHFRIIVPNSNDISNNGVNYLGFQRLTYYLTGLTDTSKIEQECLYPPERMNGEDKIIGGIIPYDVSIGRNLEILPDMIPEVIPLERYEAMRKVITGLNLVDVDLPFKNLSQVNPLMGLYKLYSYLCSEVPVERDNIDRIIPHSGIKDISFHLKKLQVTYKNSTIGNGGILTYNLTEKEKNGFTELGVYVQPVIGFLDGVDVFIRNVNYNARIGEVDSVNNNKVKVRKLNNSRDDINFIPVVNNKRLRGENIDPLSGEYGITVYDNINKKYINFHKYTIEQENQFMYDMDETTTDDNNIGFQSVIQNTEIPIIDVVRTDPITNTGTFRYSISQYNNAYSLEPNSINQYTNEFIGFDTIEVPVEINTKVVPGFGSTPNIYRPSDFDPDAIGFSSFQIQSVSNSGGSGGDSGSGNVNNLDGYMFNHNTSEPYSIESYNEEFNTNYTGFNNINVNVGELETLNVKLNKIGKYSVSYNNGLINIMPIMSSDNDNGIVVSCSDYYDNGYLPYKAFDNNMNTSYGSARPPVKENWLKVQLNEAKEVDFVRMWFRVDRYVDTIVFSGSNDDNDYIVLSEITSINYSIASDGNKYFEFSIRNPSMYLYYKFFFTYSTADFEIREINLMKYTGGYSNVNIDVNNPFGLIEANKTIDTIENNVTTTYTPYAFDKGIITDNMTNTTGEIISISDMVNSHGGNGPWNLFNTADNYYELANNSLDGEFIINFNEMKCIRSFYLKTYNDPYNNSYLNYIPGKIWIYGSNDKETFKLLYKNEDIAGSLLRLSDWKSYYYTVIDNDDEYLYYKFVVQKYNTNNYMMFNQLNLYDKYINGFEKFTFINNTYSKTSNPVATNLDPNNQRLYVNTDNSTTHPYVRREWMTVPLEDKVINYVGNYIPGDINVSSGYYGIRKITFNNNGNDIIACTNLIPVQIDDSNCSNGHLITGNYDIWIENINTSVNTNNNIWDLFSDWNTVRYGWGIAAWYYYIKGNYPFILNEILARESYMTRSMGITVYASKDGLNYIQLFDKMYDTSKIVDNKYVMYFDNKDYYLSYKVFIKGNGADGNNLTKLQFCYCNGIEISSSLIYPNYSISVNQPGIYYYNKPEGWSGINNIILSVGEQDRVVLNRVYTHNMVETILPPNGKTYINEINVEVDIQNNVINRSSSIDINDNRYKIELDVSGDQILEYKYLYKINNPSSKSINIYYRYFGDNSSNVNILSNVNSLQYEMFVQTEADKTYIYCYNYVNNVKTFISKTEINKSNLFVLGIENYNNNENLNNCSFIKEIEVGKNNDIITDNPINNNSNSVEININNNPASSSGVIVNTSSTDKGVNVYVRDRSNNNVSVANNVTGSFRVWVYRIPNDDDNVEIEVIDDNGNSYDSHVLPKSSVSKIVTSMYDFNDNFVGYETKVWNSYYSEVTFKPDTDNSVKEISEIPDYDNDFGGTGMTGLSDDALKSIVEDFNHRNDNFKDYMSVQRDQSNAGSNVNDFNEFLRDIYTPLMNGTNWNYSKLQAELTSRGISYSVSTTTITNGFPYGESGVREWAFGPGDFNNQAVVIGTMTRIHIN